MDDIMLAVFNYSQRMLRVLYQLVMLNRLKCYITHDNCIYRGGTVAIVIQ